MAPRPSTDVRERLVAALEAGVPLREAVTRFPVSERTCSRWLARYRRGERLAERPRCGRPPKRPPTRDAEVEALVRLRPDATLPEHAARREAATGIPLSPSHLSRIVPRLHLPLNKSP
jgi:transposase